MNKLSFASLSLISTIFIASGCASTTPVSAPQTPASPEISSPAPTESSTPLSPSETASEQTASQETAPLETPAEQPSNQDSMPVSSNPPADESPLDSNDADAQPQPPAAPVLSPAQQLAQQGDFAAARDLLLNDLINGNKDKSSEYWSYVDADPLMNQTLDQEVRPHGTNTISALGGGSTVSFKYQDSADPSAKAALKPDQDLRQTMYRSGVAYYRLCKLLGCSFDVPITRPARFSKSDFNALYNASDSKKNAGYRSKFEHLIWAKENGTAYLYTAYKEWISPFDFFPIEVTSAWHPYLKPGKTNYPETKAFLSALVSGSRPDAHKSPAKLIEFAQNMATRDILRQISDIILIDYLTNNWDRFSGDVNNYGANCHFHPGGIIAIDNDAAFPAWHAPRVVKRLNYVQVFSRKLVQSLRALDPDDLLSRLIPNPTKEERKSYERFKERRTDALKYIDGLIQKYGEDQILIF